MRACRRGSAIVATPSGIPLDTPENGRRFGEAPNLG